MVFNNRKYAAMQEGHVKYYAEGAAVGADLFHGVHIDGPEYEDIGKLFGFHGGRAENPGALPAAIAAGLAAVKDGKTSILNVVLNR